METVYEIESWRNPDVLESVARNHYVDLPYHNWDHAVSVRNRCRELATVCFSQGITVDVDVLEAAALWHDAGFHLRKDQYGVGQTGETWSKEKYSMYTAALDLQSLNMPNNKISKVIEAIASTEAGIECTSIEGKILAQADLENVGGDPLIFIRNTLNLYKETGMLAVDGKVPNLYDYAKGSYSYLHKFLSKDLSLGQFDIDSKNNCSYLCSNGIKNAQILKSPPKILRRWFERAEKAA